MVSEELQLVGCPKLADADSDHNIIHATVFENMLCGYEEVSDLLYELLEENKEVEGDYKKWFKFLAAESSKKRREKDEEHDINCYYEEVNDPEYELFLKSLKGHENSYILDGEENGLPVTIKYEGDSSTDKECDLEPRRKLRSSMKQKKGPRDQMPGVDNQGKNGSQSTPTKVTEKLISRQSRNKSNSEKEKNVKLSTNKMEDDPDYLTFLRSSEVVDDCYVCKYGGYNIVYELEDGENNHEKYGGYNVVYELEDGENNHEKEGCNDGSNSDVEFLGCRTFYKEGNLNSSTMNEGSTLDPKDIANFRQKVITVLRKPYNEQECDRLWQDIELRRPEERHLDLRNGRERSYSTKKDGKSLLDHYPVLERKLLRVEDDKPKCLNLLRGFFLWLQQPAPPFRPWEDAECLAITAESR